MKVQQKYRKNKLSFVPGGVTVIVVTRNKSYEYDNIKDPEAYINAVRRKYANSREPIEAFVKHEKHNNSIIPKNNREFQEGDIIARTWPSGKVTLGKAVYSTLNKDLDFISLETYDKEGGIIKGGCYGPANQEYAGIPHRLATPDEILSFLGSLNPPLNEEKTTHSNSNSKIKRSNIIFDKEEHIKFRKINTYIKRTNY